VTYHSDPFLPPDDLGSESEHVAAFYSIEEKAHEAVIDTGASRSVIGAELVGGLVNGIVEKTGWKIKRVPSTVQFRFGNSGALQIEYAICIPRQQKGWIRVEVVPGRTPFLISNTALKEIGALIDPRNQQLRFLETNVVIPLGTFRKNLLRDVVALLKVEHSKEGKEEIYHTKETTYVSWHDDHVKNLMNKSSDKHKGLNSFPPFSPPCCMTEMQKTHVQNIPLSRDHAETPIVDQKAIFQAQTNHPDQQNIVHVGAMSNRPGMSFLQDELSGEEDSSLTLKRPTLRSKGSYKMPPGIRTLLEWGQQVIPSGKQAGKTFEKVFLEDDG